jgi:hypothetical protein
MNWAGGQSSNQASFRMAVTYYFAIDHNRALWAKIHVAAILKHWKLDRNAM